MTVKITGLSALVFLFTAVAAQAADSEPPASAYRKVMEAQYAAKGAAPPARPEEVRRIHESYLNSIGKPAKDLDADNNTITPSR